MKTLKNDIEVNARFDSGVFGYFEFVSTKNMKYENIQKAENLTFDDFTALEIVLGQAVSDFLDMKHKELKEL